MKLIIKSVLIALIINAFYHLIIVDCSCEGVNEHVRQITIDGDIVLGGLFPISERFDCKGTYHQERGVERAEAMVRAISLINNDTNILKGITLGYDIRDTCNREEQGIEETIGLIQGNPSIAKEDQKTPIGIIGASSSSVSVPVASLLRVFETSQISYASTSPLLSDRQRYGYFFRTVGSGTFLAQAVADIVKKYKWKEIFTMYTFSTYGSPGIQAFMDAISEFDDVCVKAQISLEESTDHRAIARKLIASSVNVTFCYCASNDGKLMLNAVNEELKAQNISKSRFLWLASDGWTGLPTVVENAKEVARGYIGFTPLTEQSVDFNNYFPNLNPYKITHNPWFCGFFRQRYDCSYNESDSKQKCPESITHSQIPYSQNIKVPNIYDAIYSFAYALDSILKQNCYFEYNISKHKCASKHNQSEFTNIGGELLRNTLYNTNFFSNFSSSNVYFDSLGNGPSRFQILNYQYNENDNSYSFVSVGRWDVDLPKENRLQLTSNIQFGPQGNVTSYCDGIYPCSKGYKTIYTRPETRCCWTCELCQANTFSNETLSANCTTCPEGYWGVNPMGPNTECQSIDVFKINFNIILCYILLAIAAIGFLGYTIVCVIYFANWTNVVVKQSGREHCTLILIGSAIPFPLVLLVCGKPTIPTCIIYTLLFWFSLSLLIFPLLTKIVRIVRVFLITGKDLTKRQFLTWPWQILFDIIPIIAVQVLIIISYSTRLDIVEIVKFDRPFPSQPLYNLQCIPMHKAFDTIIAFIFILSLLILLMFAVMTRSYPKNYNESVHIMYASISIIIILILVQIVHFVLEANFAIYLHFVDISGLMLIACAVLLSFFGPRVFFIIVKKKDNEKEKVRPTAEIDNNQFNQSNTELDLNNSTDDILSSIQTTLQ